MIVLGVLLVWEILKQGGGMSLQREQKQRSSRGRGKLYC